MRPRVVSVIVFCRVSSASKGQFKCSRMQQQWIESNLEVHQLYDTMPHGPVHEGFSFGLEQMEVEIIAACRQWNVGTIQLHIDHTAEYSPKPQNL